MEDYHTHIRSLSGSDLIKMINSEDEYRPEAIEAAREEIEKRGGIENLAATAIEEAEASSSDKQITSTEKPKSSPWKSGCITIILVVVLMAFLKGFLDSSEEDERPKKLQNDIQVAITREETFGLKESQLNDLSIVKALENKTSTQIENRCREAYYAQGNTSPVEINTTSESWVINVDGRSFVIIRVNVSNTAQSTAVMGIQDDTFIRISGFKLGTEPVPHATGALANKVKEVFGVDLIKY